MRSVLSMAEGLQLDVVAEGAESAQQAAVRRALGSGRGQGFHLARPMPVDDLARLLAGQQQAAAGASSSTV